MEDGAELQPFRFSDAGTLPPDFNVKKSLLRCKETDRIWNATRHDSDLETQELAKALPKVDGWIAEGIWHDAYQLLRYAQEKGFPIDQDLHMALGDAMITRATVAFSQIDVWRRDGAPRLAGLGDFAHFMFAHNERYPDRPHKLESAVQFSKVFFDTLATDWKAEYELMDAMHDVGWSDARKEPYIVTLLEFHPDREVVKAQIIESYQAALVDSPSTALERIRKGYRIGLFDKDEVNAFFEQALDAVDVARMVMSEAGPTTKYYPPGEEQDYYCYMRVGDVVERILHGAVQREQEVLGRRKTEYAFGNLESLRGTAGEFAVLRRVLSDSQVLDQPVPEEVIDRVIALATFRGDTLFDPNLREALKTLIFMSQDGQIDPDRLLISFGQITERYLAPVKKSGPNDLPPEAPGQDASDKEWRLYFDEVLHEEIRSVRGVSRFIEKFAFALWEAGESMIERRIADFIPLQDLFEMIDRYEAYTIEPYRHLITPERQRLVTTYERSQFRNADEYKRQFRGNDGLVFMPRVQHPEKGAVNMIALYPLKVTARAEALKHLRAAIETNNVGKLIEWHDQFRTRQLVPFMNTFHDR